MGRVRTSALVGAAILCVTASAAAAAPQGSDVQLRDRSNDTSTVAETVGRTTEGTLDIVSASMTPGRTGGATTRPGNTAPPTTDLRAELRLAYAPSRTAGVVYRVSGSTPGLCGRADSTITIETVMTENGPLSHLRAPCTHDPVPVQTEIRGDGFSWYVPASAFPREVRRGLALRDVRADTGWVQVYVNSLGLVRGYGAYEPADEALSRASYVLR